MDEINVERQEGGRKYHEHRGQPHMIDAEDMRRRNHIFVSVLSFDSQAGPYIDGRYLRKAPMQSQAMHMLVLGPDNTTQLGLTVRPLIFGARMSKPRMKRARDGHMEVEHIDDKSGSGVSWLDFQAMLEETVIGLE